MKKYSEPMSCSQKMYPAKLLAQGRILGTADKESLRCSRFIKAIKKEKKRKKEKTTQKKKCKGLFSCSGWPLIEGTDQFRPLGLGCSHKAPACPCQNLGSWVGL